MAIGIQRGRRMVPLALGFAMLAVVAAGLTPFTGAVPSDTACSYGVCPTQTNSGSALPWEIALGILVLAAIVLGIVLWLQRRRRGGGGSGPVEAWSGATPPSGAVGGVEPPESPMAPDAAELGAAAAGGAGAGVAAAYVETPEDVGTAPPPVEAPAGATGAPQEADIDSLMQELDKISTEILKRRPPKGPQSSDPPDSDEGAAPSGN